MPVAVVGAVAAVVVVPLLLRMRMIGSNEYIILMSKKYYFNI